VKNYFGDRLAVAKSRQVEMSGSDRCVSDRRDSARVVMGTDTAAAAAAA